jgi:hypothetical protein
VTPENYVAQWTKTLQAPTPISRDNLTALWPYQT